MFVYAVFLIVDEVWHGSQQSPSSVRCSSLLCSSPFAVDMAEDLLALEFVFGADVGIEVALSCMSVYVY